MVRGSNLGVGEIFLTRQDQAWDPSSLLCDGYRVFAGGGVDHTTPLGAEVKVRVELYIYSPSVPSWPVIWWTLPLPLIPYSTFSSSPSTSLPIPNSIILQCEDLLSTAENPKDIKRVWLRTQWLTWIVLYIYNDTVRTAQWTLSLLQEPVCECCRVK